MKKETYKRVIFDIISAAISWIAFFYYRKKIIEDLTFELSTTLLYGTVAVTTMWFIIYVLSENYTDVRRVSRLNELYRTITQSLIGCFIIFFCLIIDDIDNYQNYTFYYQAIVALITIHFFTTFTIRYIITNSMVKKIQNGKIGFNTIIIGNTKIIKQTIKSIKSINRSTGNNLIGYINCEDIQIENIQIPKLGQLDDLENIIKKEDIEEAILAFDYRNMQQNSQIINTLAFHDIITKVPPSLVDLLSGKVKMRSLFDVSFIEIKQIKMSLFTSFTKRTIDIIASGSALILLSPFLIIISILVKLSSKGPIFYHQERLGLKTNVFQIIKFRSMYTDAEKKTPLLSSDNDTRITKWGKIMRKYRLDELPQFYNVLVGEMSIIGPRPERSFFAEKILKKAPHYRLVHKVKPGITSWGMVKFGYAENVEEMILRLKYDIIYLENLSLFSDFKVFVLTIFIILQGRGK